MSQRERFSLVRLGTPGCVREIVVLSRPGDTPVLRIEFRRDDYPAGALAFRGAAELAVLTAALREARCPTLEGSRVVGDIEHTPEITLRVRATRFDGFEPAVGFRRWLRPENRFLGRETRISGAELDSLERALAHVRQITAAPAARTESPA